MSNYQYQTHNIKNNSEACKNTFHDFWAVHMLKICIKLWRALRTKDRSFQFLCFLGPRGQNVGTAWNSKFTSCRITLKAPDWALGEELYESLFFQFLMRWCAVKTSILKENPSERWLFLLFCGFLGMSIFLHFCKDYL